MLTAARGALPRACWRAAATTIATAAACLLLGSEAAHAADKGVVTDMTWQISDHEMALTEELLEDSGAGWVRMQLDWNWLDADPGLIRMYDDAVDTARAAGTRVLLIASQTPSWASGSAKAEAPPLDPGTYGDWLRTMVAHFKGRVDAYEIWNEPDTLNFWPSGPDAADYVALLKAGHAAVKDVDPSAEVVFGGLVGGNREYLEEAYAAEPDLGRWFDVMAVHPYVAHGGAPDVVKRGPDGHIERGSFASYRELHDVLVEHGDDKPMWITEFGYATTTQAQYWGGVDEQTQADYLRRAYEFLEQDPYVEILYWYNLRNNFWAPEADTWEDQLGLVRANFAPKPAYAAFRDYVPPSELQPPPAEVAEPAPPPAASPAPAVAAPTEQAQPEIPVRLRLTGISRRNVRGGKWTIVSVRGRVAGTAAARVQLRVAGRHRVARRTQTASTAVVDGRLTWRIRLRRGGRWRVRAIVEHSTHGRVRTAPLAFAT